MTAKVDLVDALGRAARSVGWTLVKTHDYDGGKVGVLFEVNNSPYGANSSKARAKEKVAMLTEVLTGMVLEQQREIGRGDGST